MATRELTFVTALFTLFQTCSGYVECGDWVCYGTGAYCCDSNPGFCCYHVWSFWWFWMVWILLFTFLLSCGYWCRYQRRSRRAEIIVVRHPHDVYAGTVYGTVQGPMTTAPTGPVLPQKPPAYSGPQDRPPAYNTNMPASK